MSDAGGPLSFGDDPPREEVAGERGSQPSPPGLPGTPATGPSSAVAGRLPRRLLAAAGLVLLAVVLVNTLRTHGAPSGGPPAGSPMPPFAAPLATSALAGDVNVARRPGQGAAGRVPACTLRGPEILNSCDLVRGAPAAIVFFVAGKDRCVREVDRLMRAAASRPGVRIAAVALRGSRGAVRDLVARRGWRLPVAHDRDAVLGNLYGVVVCPQVTYVLPGGRVRGSTIGELSDAALGRRLDDLLRAAARAPAGAGGAAG